MTKVRRVNNLKKKKKKKKKSVSPFTAFIMAMSPKVHVAKSPVSLCMFWHAVCAVLFPEYGHLNVHYQH
jgi:hypothetical protein